jgi:hypothetical protein
MNVNAWTTTVSTVTSLMKHKAFNEAVAGVNAYLASRSRLRFRREALMLRAEVFRLAGKPDLSRSDLEAARKLTRPGEHGRYTIELTLAGLSEEQGLAPDAEKWYRRCLKTCVTGTPFSAGMLLLRFTRFRRNSRMTNAERSLCKKIIQRSWKSLGLPSSADDLNFEGAAEAIVRAEAIP